MYKKISNKNYFKTRQDKPKTNFDIYLNFSKNCIVELTKDSCEN